MFCWVLSFKWEHRIKEVAEINSFMFKREDMSVCVYDDGNAPHHAQRKGKCHSGVSERG